MQENSSLKPNSKEQVTCVRELRLADVLTTELKNRRISAAEVCRELGIPKSVFSGWLNGVSPSAKNLPLIRKLASFLDLPIDILLFNTKTDETGEASTVLFSSTFKDEKHRYKLTIEKILDKGTK
jgi:transcriptional regulator with XRE-family HTH domain